MVLKKNYLKYNTILLFWLNQPEVPTLLLAAEARKVTIRPKSIYNRTVHVSRDELDLLFECTEHNSEGDVDAI